MFLCGAGLHQGADPAQFAPRPCVKCDTSLASSQRPLLSENYISNRCTLDCAHKCVCVCGGGGGGGG